MVGSAAAIVSSWTEAPEGKPVLVPVQVAPALVERYTPVCVPTSRVCCELAMEKECPGNGIEIQLLPPSRDSSKALASIDVNRRPGEPLCASNVLSCR